MKRGIRREQRKRKVSQAKAVLKTLGFDQKDAPRWANNLAKCSCHMCCNPRRNDCLKGEERLTLQERRANANYRDQLKEL